jgi:hypothetical protein
MDRNYQWDDYDRPEMKQRHDNRHRRSRRRAPGEHASVHRPLLALRLLKTQLERLRFALAAHQPSTMGAIGRGMPNRQWFQTPGTRFPHRKSIRTDRVEILLPAVDKTF